MKTIADQAEAAKEHLAKWGSTVQMKCWDEDDAAEVKKVFKEVLTQDEYNRVQFIYPGGFH